MPYQIYLRPTYPNELYHHGIKGQKWGIRRFQNPDGTLTAAGKKRYLKDSKKDRGVTETVAIAAAVALALDAVPVIKAKMSAATARRRYVQLMTKWSDATKEARQADYAAFDKYQKEREEAVVDKTTGLRVKSDTSKERDVEEDVKRVNPYFLLRRWDSSVAGTTSNCVNCSVAVELRRRGYEVQAKLHTNGRDATKAYKSYFTNYKEKEVIKRPPFPDLKKKDDMDDYLAFYREAERKKRAGNEELIQKVNEAMSKEPEGSRGHISLRWGLGCGHSTSYEVLKDGKWRIIEGQNGKVYEGAQLEALLKEMCDFTYARTDNLKFDAKKIKEAIK